MDGAAFYMGDKTMEVYCVVYMGDVLCVARFLWMDNIRTYYFFENGDLGWCFHESANYFSTKEEAQQRVVELKSIQKGTDQ